MAHADRLLPFAVLLDINIFYLILEAYSSFVEVRPSPASAAVGSIWICDPG